MSMTKIIIYRILDSLMGNHIGYVCCVEQVSKACNSLYIYFEPANMNQTATGNIVFLHVNIRKINAFKCNADETTIYELPLVFRTIHRNDKLNAYTVTLKHSM